MSAMKPSAPRIFSWLLAVLFPIFAIYPALSNAIEEHAYDAAEFHIFRGVVFSAARADGVFYPRWVQPINGGLGGPLFEFYSPLPYFLMDVLNAIGIAHPIGWRILTALALVAASTGMFGLALALFRRADVALLSAAIFSYNEYLLRDLFERGSPQGWAVALLPWLLWLLFRAYDAPSGIRTASAGGCFAAIMLIHNATALLLTPVVAIFVLFLISRDARRARAPILGLIAGLLISAFYLIPYLAEIQFVQFDNPLYAGYTLPAANPLRLEDFLSLPRIFDVGLGNNAIAESGGLLHAAALLLAIPVGAGFYRTRRWAELLLVIGSLLLAIGVIWLQTDSATFVWNAVPALNVFQFRWRLLSILGLVTAILVGYFVSQPSPRFRGAAITFLITIYFLLALPSLYPDLLFRYIQFPTRPTVADAQSFAAKSNAAGLTSFNEYLPRWRQSPITSYQSPITSISNLPSEAKIRVDSNRTGFIQARIETPLAFTAAMNVLYYPGWAGYVDAQAAPIRPSAPDGLIELNVPAGAHTVELRYEGTTAQHLGDVVSILAVIALAVVCVMPAARVLAWLGRLALPATRVVEALRRGRASATAESSHAAYATAQPPFAYLAPRWWVPILILLLAAFKASWVDPNSTLFRANSTCAAVQDSVVQTNVSFGNRIRLCGYALPLADFQPGDQVRMTLYWQVDSPARENDFSFVHLLGDQFNPETNNPLWGQQDEVSPGEHALSDWQPGKLYRDVYQFRVAPGTPSGEYQLELGWQDASGQRLAPVIVSGNDRLTVSHLDSLLISGIRIR
jgi:6-pyruvoyl-tetrahydropterin synthase-like protein